MLPPCLGLSVYCSMFLLHWLLMAFDALICAIDYGLSFDR